jgi:L-lactate dehydrogenase complex protein LldF
LNPQVEGLEAAGVLATASSLCNACEEVCPVKIPIPELIRRIRNESYSKDPASTVEGHGYKSNWKESLAWKLWAIANTHPFFNSAYRSTPEVAPQSLHELVKQNGVDNE